MKIIGGTVVAETFEMAVDRAARAMLARRPQGICLNGSDFNAVAGESGYQAVNPSDVARDVQDEARKRGKRWVNCNGDTVWKALRYRGWVSVYAARKQFLFLDRAEASRCEENYREAKSEKREKSHAKFRKREALAAEKGTLASYTVFYAKRAGQMKAPRRYFDAAEAEILDAMAKAAASEKVVAIRVGGKWSYGSGWSWQRQA